MTITLEEEVAKWARIRAAESDTSVSRFVGEMLKERMANEERYDNAMQDYLSRSPQVLKKPGAAYPTRGELHDRETG